MRNPCNDDALADHVVDRQSWLAAAFLLALAGLVFTIAGGMRLLAPPDCQLQSHWLRVQPGDAATATSRRGAPCLISPRDTQANVAALELVTPPRNGRIDKRGKTGLIYVPNAQFRGQDSFDLKVLRNGEPNAAARVINMKVNVDW